MSTPTIPEPQRVPYDPDVEEFLANFREIDQRIKSFPFVESDGEPLDSPWHRDCINLLISSILVFFRDRTDFYVGGNMFIYFDEDRARTLSYKGPDFFFVWGRPLRPQRRFWLSWVEGKLPNVIIELLSPTTAKEDLTTKFTIYEQNFRTPEYFCYDPAKKALQGWILAGGSYVPLAPNDKGWLWSKELGLWVGTWEGEYFRDETTWLRFYDPSGNLVLTDAELEAQKAKVEKERAEAEAEKAKVESERADAERRRAEAAEAELARLKAQLGEQTKNGGPAASMIQ